MGCAASRAQLSDTVRGCRERRNLMKTTIQSLHNLASSHAAYLSSLRHTAAALSVFASGEPLEISELTPPVFVQYPANNNSPNSAHDHDELVILEDQRNAVEDNKKTVVEVRTVVRHRNLAEVAAAVAECFVKASVAGEAVLELLENGPKEKKMAHYSNGLLKALSSRSRSRKLQETRRQLEIAGIQGSVPQRNHAFTLEKLYAWEKNLYKEIKKRERIKIKYDRNRSTLERVEHRGNGDSIVARTRTNINKLQPLLTVARDAVSATAASIIQARDNELAPQLLELFQGNLKMWRKMNHMHNAQHLIIQQVTGLVISGSSSHEETSKIHHAATGELQIAVSNWQAVFSQLMKCHRNYIHCTRIWLKRTLSELCNDSSPAAVRLADLCNAWNQAVDRAPDKSVTQSIKKLVNSIHVIYTKQAEELRIKKHLVTYKNKLERRSKSLRKMEKRYYKSYNHADAPTRRDFRDYRDREDYERQMLDEEKDREMLKKKKAEIVDWLRKVEKENNKHVKAVEETRLAALNGVKSSLPGVFQAMAAFSGIFVGILEDVEKIVPSTEQSEANGLVVVNYDDF